MRTINISEISSLRVEEARWVLLYMAYIGTCGPKGYGFSAVLVINRASILAILVTNMVLAVKSCIGYIS